MKKLTLSLFFFSSLAFPYWQPALAVEPDEDLTSLQAELKALKEEQAAILNELKEIKEILKPRRPELVENVNLVLSVAEDPAKGDRDAKLTLVEFSDYQCPFCARHTRGVLPQLEKDYISTNKVKYILRDYPLPLHPNAAKAAEAAHCAGEQGQYWQMHDQLFSNQQALQADQLPKYAEKIGLNLPAFQTCLDSSKYADKAKDSLTEGSNAGVQGTPTFLLGFTDAHGSKVKAVQIIRGAQPYPVFKKSIDELLVANPGLPDKPN